MRVVTLALGIAVTLAVPVILAVTGIRIVTHDRYVEAVYDHGGIPADRYGMPDAERTRLALTGLRSILPSTNDGIDLLRTARLHDGSPAFDGRELRHMADVRTLVSRAYDLQLVLLIAIGVLALLLGLRRATRTVVPTALARGAVLTVAVALTVAVVAAIRYDVFETAFHGLFFDPGSWRFAETETLRRLYPDRFWLDTAVSVGALAVAQAIALFLLARVWARRASARQAFRMRARTQSS
jgi:integral membrane protein (TIGR01906 family)